jgi:hypothetical protein
MYALQQVLWVVGLGLSVALVVKMAVQRLSRIYVWFFVFLCFEILRSVILLPISPKTNVYAWLFLTSQPMLWLIYVLVVMELYSLAFAGYKGITSLSRWVVAASLGLAVGVSVLTLSADLARPTGRFKILVYYSVIERGLVFSLVVFLLLITLFLLWFPISVRWNLLLHAGLYSLYFMSSTFALFVRNVSGYQTTPAINAVLMLINIVCFGEWLWRFDKAGEAEPAPFRKSWRPEDEERLLRQMEALNNIILRRSDQ